MTTLISDLSDIGGYSGDFYFTSTANDASWLQEPLPVEKKDEFAVTYNPSFNYDETFGGESFHENLALMLQSEFTGGEIGEMNEQPKLKRMRLTTNEEGLKRGPKHMTLEERQISKNAFIKLYQDIWRLLFRKNSTVTLTDRGKMCCSFYVNQNLLKCPSGKSPDHDLFRTIEHLWSVIQLSSPMNTDYGLKQYFFMKCLISWKLQPRFTDAVERPDVEALENDRVFQNGKKRSEIHLKVTGELNDIKRTEIIKLNDSLWQDLELYDVRVNTKDLPSMAMVLSYLNTLCFQKSISYSAIKREWPANPSEIGAFMLECNEGEHNILKAAQILSKYCNLIRKTNGRGEFYRGDIAKNPKIAKSYEDSCEIVNNI